MLPLWGDVLLAFVAIVASVLAWQARSRERVLADRLAARERGGHFLGESPEPGEILKHAYAAASEIVPVTRFDLYRIDSDGRVEEACTLGPDEAGTVAPSLEPGNPWVGNKVDARRMRELSATETERSFAPLDLLAGGSVRRLRLPLYSGDRLVAHLDLGSATPIDAERKAEIRALLGPLTASLHASRNWAVAVTDELSGLSSRRYFEARLSEEWARLDRYETPLSIACFDLDRFKSVNDTLGHAAGDLVIRKFGEIIRSVVRASDLACRLGGEEFAALFPNTRQLPRAGRRAHRRRSRERFERDGKDFWVTVSAGVRSRLDAGSGPRKLLAPRTRRVCREGAGEPGSICTDRLGREGARARPEEPAPAGH